VVSFDEALAVLENPTRRQILRRLVKEPHYPLQLSELLDVSQQAVVKHLKVLEESEFVDSERVPSEKVGPPKKMYRVDQSFSLRLDLGPDLRDKIDPFGQMIGYLGTTVLVISVIMVAIRKKQ